MTRLLCIVSASLFSLLLQAQTGLWEVTNVSAGDQTMTPVAKWFDIRSDHTILGGNGGMINIRGTYQTNPEITEFLFIDEDRIPDEMGKFAVEVNNESMTWQREEQGMNVVVSLKKIDKIPEGPWDKLTGPWSCEDKEFADMVFMSWDRSFRMQGGKGLRRGIWHIGAHNPEVILYYQDGTTETWMPTFSDPDTMIWQSDFGDEKVFTHLKENQ